MKKGVLFFSTFICLLGLTSHFKSQERISFPADSICWNTGTKLKWRDFKGRPDSIYGNALDEATAATQAIVTAVAYEDQEFPHFRVSCYFVRSRSWSRDTSDVRLLNHEQLHFDIAELCARRIRQGIQDLNLKKVKMPSAYQRIITDALRDLEVTNNKYDNETFFGAIDFRQEIWNKKVSSELELLKQFSVDECKN